MSTKETDIMDNIPGIGQESGELQCPRCGEPYLHHSAVRVYDRSEDDEQTMVTIVTKDDITREERPSAICCNPSARRDGVVIDFWCEHCDVSDKGEPTGNSIQLTLAQHKGYTYLEWRGLCEDGFNKPAAPVIRLGGKIGIVK